MKINGIAARTAATGVKTDGIAARTNGTGAKIGGIAAKTDTTLAKRIGMRRVTIDAMIADTLPVVWAETIESIGDPTTATTAGVMTGRLA